MKYPKTDGKAKRIIRSGVPYQGDRLAAALPFLRGRRRALDIGAHIGLWAVQLAPVFAKVACFEPHRASAAALCENVADLENVETWEAAVGDVLGVRGLVQDGLAAHLDDDGPMKVSVVRLDDICERYGWDDVDFIKMDVEGFEYFVLLGGEKMIRAQRPVIVLEQKHDGRYGVDKLAAISLLQRWGATLEWRMKHDYCLRWKR